MQTMCLSSLYLILERFIFNVYRNYTIPITKNETKKVKSTREIVAKATAWV